MHRTNYLLVAALLLAALPSTFAQIPNDDCTTAEALLVSPTEACDFPVSGSTLYALSTGLGVCEPQSPDAWYSFVATATVHSLRLYEVRNAYNYWQTEYAYLEIFTGDCAGGQLQRLFCTSWETSTFGEFVPGQTYYLRVVASNYVPINFQLCVYTPNQPPPPNDACAGATVLAVDHDAQCDALLAASTAYATLNPAPVCPGCAPYLHDDVWYAFTATQATQVVALDEVKSISLGAFSTITVETYTGDCANPVWLNRDTSFFRAGKIIFTDLSPGQTYRLRLYSNYSDAPLQFNLCVNAPPPPANDDCSSAQPLVPVPGLDCSGLSQSGTLLGAAADGLDCQGGAVRDVWYQFIATSPSVRVSVSPVINEAYGFEVYSGDCTNLISLACAGSDDLARLLNNLSVGATYYVRVFSHSIQYFDFHICLLELPAPPVNDECAGALPLAISTGYTCDAPNNGSTLGATFSLPACDGLESTHDVWYSFVAAGPSHRLILAGGSDIFGYSTQFAFEVFSGDCDNLVSLGCGHTEMYSFNAELRVGGLTPGETYFVRAYSLAGSAHEFTFCLQTLPPPPANATCQQAATLISTQDCPAPATGNTAGVLSLESLGCGDGKGLWYSFVAAHTTELVKISHVQSLFEYDNGYWLDVLEGPDCNSLSSLRCIANAMEVQLDNLTLGKTYFLRFASAPASAHSFEICLNHFSPPANDACGGAQPLVMHGNLNCYYPSQGTTAGATAEQTGGCVSGGDVWFRFTAIQTTQRLVISNLKTLDGGPAGPLQAELLGGACGSLNSLFCWDNLSGTSINLFLGELTPGQTYYLRIANPDNMPLRFDVCALTPPKPPDNDACAQATVLIPEAGDNCNSVTGITTNATPTPGLPVPTGQAEGDIWYAFTASQVNHDVNLLWINGYPDDKAIVEVYAGGCGAFSLLIRQKMTGGGLLHLTQLTPGATYRVRVFPENVDDIAFGICINSPLVPINDECVVAGLLPVNLDKGCSFSLEVNTIGATQSRPACDGDAVTDVWYQFSATDAAYRFDISSNLTGQSVAGGIEILTGDCVNPTSLFCYELPALPIVIQESGFVSGQTYFVRFWGRANTVQRWSVCAFALPPAPANDNCDGALPLPILVGATCASPTLATTLSTSYATNYNVGGCQGQPQVQDIWYTFTATEVTNVLEIATTANYFNAYQKGYELYAGADCSSINAVRCWEFYEDQYQGVLDDLVPGQTYFLRLYTFGWGAQDFSLCLRALPPAANAECGQATPVAPNPDLQCNTVYPGTTAGGKKGSGMSSPGGWFKFTANSEALFFQLKNVQLHYGTGGSLNYMIYHGPDCANLQFVGNYDIYQQTLVNGLIPGDTYFIYVYGSNGHYGYDFELCIQTPPPAPSNDLCSGALSVMPNTGLTCDIITHGSTAGAALDNAYGCYSGGPLYDVWYSFTATSSVHAVEATNVTPLTSTGDNLFEVVALQSADCLNFTQLGCSYFGNKMYLRGLIPGETYYLAAVSRQHTFHAFDLCITTYPIPANDLCQNAIDLPVSPTSDCDSPMAGTSLGATTAPTPGCGVHGSDVWYSFTATQSAQTISVTDVLDGLSGSYTYFDLEVFQNGCGSLQSLACRTDQIYGANLTVGELVPGAQYWIRISGGASFNICVTTPDMAPPNDGCSSAQPLAVSPDENCLMPTPGTTEFATPSNQALSLGGISTDVWYSFTATQASHAVILSNFSNYFGNYLSVLFYSGTCGALTQEGLQLVSLNGQFIWLSSNLTPGETYYVRVFNAAYDQPASFDICVISLAPPPNDACANATALPVSDDLSCPPNTTFATLGATPSAPGCSGDIVNDVWFRFTATAASARLDLSGDYGSSSVYNLEILEGDCAAPTVFLPCADYNYEQVFYLNLTVGQTYYLRLSMAPADYKNFTLCVRNLPAMPANDDCAQATVIQPGNGFDCGTVYNGSTVAASQSATNCNGDPASDVWYQFTATSTSHVLRLAGGDYPFGQGAYPALEMYSGTGCGNLSPVFCQYFNDYAGGMKILEGLTVGQTYFLRVFSEKNRPYDFSICLGTLPLVPANADCAQAIPLIPSPDMQCTQPVSGSTAGLTQSASYYPCYANTSLWYHFKATAYTHFIQLRNIAHAYGEPTLRLGLFKGSDCYSLQNLNCSDLQEMLAVNLVPGEDYYIQVGGALQSGSSFELCVLTPMPPANDHCAGLVMLPVSPTADCPLKTSGTNLGATGSYGLGCGDGPDVLYAFVATGTEHLINITNVRPTQAYHFVEVLTGDCGNWNNSLGCFPTYNNPIQLYDLTPGTTYYLRIGASYPDYFYFDICVGTPQPNLYLQSVIAYGNGCQAGNNETVEVTFSNSTGGVIAANTAQFLLHVSGANNAVYGPLFNTGDVGLHGSGSVTFTGIDLSNPGESQLFATAVLPNDAYTPDNTASNTFYSLPLVTLYRDADFDGYGNNEESLSSCFTTYGYVLDNTDCNDNDYSVHPGAAEVCNGYDDDCNGLADAADPTLSDAPMPDIACPGDITVNNDPGLCSAVIQYSVTTTDHCGYAVTQPEGLVSGSAFPIGTTLNRFVVSDLAGTSAACSFSVTVEKSADPDLSYAYAVIGLNDVYLKKNTVQSGGVGVVNAGKKARLPGGTTVTASNTFVKAPIIELTGGSLATTTYTGQLPAASLPAFKSNSAPTSNNVTVPNNAAPLTLSLGSYGNIIVGINSTIIFSGQSSVLIKELTLKEGAKVIFNQSTEMLINKGITIGRNVEFNPSGAQAVQVFAAKTVMVSVGAKINANLYTLADLRLEKATAATAISMAGQFIALNVYAEDFATWNWNAGLCPPPPQRPEGTERKEEIEAAATASGQLRIFPNPTTGELRLEWSGEEQGEVTVQIVNSMGQVMRALPLPKASTPLTAHLEGLPNGMYLVRVLAEARMLAEKKLVKQ